MYVFYIVSFRVKASKFLLSHFSNGFEMMNVATDLRRSLDCLNAYSIFWWLVKHDIVCFSSRVLQGSGFRCLGFLFWVLGIISKILIHH